MKSLCTLLSFLLLTSCATTMPGKELNINSKYLGATLSENTAYSSDEIKMYQVSVKNLTNEWIEIDSAIIGKNIVSAKILMGDRISSWIEASTLENRVSDYNTQLFLGALAATGAVVGVTSKSSTTSAVGFSVSLGSIAASGVKDIMESKNKAEFQATFPEGHILRPFVIPPKKVIQRWIIVENPKKEDVLMTLISKSAGVGEVSFYLNK